MPWFDLNAVINDAFHRHRAAMRQNFPSPHAWQTRAWEHPWAVMQLPKPPVRIADFGCGDRPFPPYLASLGYAVVGIDKIEHGKDGPIWGLPEGWERPNSDRLAYVKADMADLPFDDEEFDAGLCISVFEHMSGKDEVKAALKEMLRAIRKGGKLICTGDVRMEEESPFWREAVISLGLWTDAMEGEWRDPPNSRIWVGPHKVTVFGFVIAKR